MPLFNFSRSSRSNPPAQTPPIPTVQRQERTKARRQSRPRSVYVTPPGIGPRESSLYLPAVGSESPFTSPPAFPIRHSFPPTNQSSLDIPEYGFFDTQAHSDIWEELFTSANHTTQGRVEKHQQERKRLTSASVLGLTMPGEEVGLHEESMGRAMKSEIWVKSPSEEVDDMPAPAVPPRSRLRSVPPPVPSERRSSLYLLPVDQPLPVEDTPSLSSGSSSDNESPNLTMSPASDTIRFGRKPRGLDRDPHKIRDGADARRSSSGVYTPPTFPGAQGPRPSHFPTHVYTPAAFTLIPTAPRPTPNNYAYEAPSGTPSRSTSMSSSTSGSDTSPLTPTGRFSGYAGKTLAGLRRISNQVTPISLKDSYFPPVSAGTSIHSRESSAGPSTPTSAIKVRDTSSYFPPASPAGLGVGLPDDSHTSWSSKSSVLFDETHQIGVMRSPQQPQAKGKRKPVPRILDDELLDRVAVLQVDESHAM